MSALTPHALDAYAERYYLNQEDVADLHVEDLQQEHSADLIARAIRGCGRVLELGYGVGLMTGALRDRGVPIEVVEGSPLLAAQARAAHPGLVVHEAMFEAFAPATAFDAVLALHVVEHVDEPRPLLTHLAGLLRPGGKLVVVVPNAESLHRRLAVRMGLQERLDSLSPRDHLVGHQRVYTLDELRADVESAGLQCTEELGWFLKTLPNSMMLDWPSELLIALNEISDELEPRQLANIGLVATKEP
ncbi:class I SAM-dependent methyltransferase [Paraconexibacter sp.]|uniref:class I SAM-dependent methyltransferase n=1 Tax=Paraconexibacter sp. TaxID=2949640 RepID=UPI003564E00D